MKKFVLGTLLTPLLTLQLHAGGDIAPVEPSLDIPEVHGHTHSDYYVIVKGLRISGDNVDHEGVSLEGDSGYGFGLDFGYRLGHGFALEYDFSYAENSVSEVVDGHIHEVADAKYYTHALDLVYTYELTETLGLFAKAGYEYEIEEVEDYDIDTDDNGFNYGIGVEIAVDDTYKLIAEYEHSTIEGPRGSSLFAGIMYNF